MGDYATHADVEKRIPDIIGSGAFSDFSNPTPDDVDEWIDQVDGEINSRLATHGYVNPVVVGDDPQAFDWVKRGVIARVCVLVLSNKPMASFDPDVPAPQTNRMGMFWQEWASLVEMITSEELVSTRTVDRGERLVVGSAKNSDGDTIDPVFTRGMFDYGGGPGARGRTSSSS